MSDPNQRIQEAQWDMFWIPRDVRVIDRPELLYLVCDRPVFYLNQVMRTRAPAVRLPALIDEALEAHARSGSSWLVYDTDDPALEPLLAASGYAADHRGDAMVLEASDFRARATGAVSVQRVEDMDQLRDHMHVMETTFGLPLDHPDGELDEFLALCTGAGARVARFLARDADARPIAAGAMNLYPALDLAYFWGGCTIPEARGQGAYHALLAARVQLARRHGIRTIAIYADTSTSSPIVSKLGFQRCGGMTNWRHPPRS